MSDTNKQEISLDKIDKRITCVVEDYKALKSEISRRSDLQRFALLAYGGVIVLSLKFNDNTSFYDFQIILIWLTSSLAYFFYYAEDNIIKRLAKTVLFNNWLFGYLIETEDKKNLSYKLIKVHFENYETNANKNQENITLADIIFPSESPSIVTIIETKDSKRKAEINNIIFLTLYLIALPSIITMNYFFRGNNLEPCISVFYLLLFLSCAVTNICISKHLYDTNIPRYR